jgi:putative acetyltransferase
MLMNIHIRHAEKADVPAIADLYGQPHAVMGTLQQPFPSQQIWENRTAGWGDSVRSLLAEVNGHCAGHLGVMLPANPRRKHTASIAMGVHRDYLKQGVGSALLSAAIDLCDNWLNIERMELEVFVDNESAIKLYKRSGFETEGTLKKYAFRNGEYCDVLTMARFKPSGKPDPEQC